MFHTLKVLAKEKHIDLGLDDSKMLCWAHLSARANSSKEGKSKQVNYTWSQHHQGHQLVNIDLFRIKKKIKVGFYLLK